MTRHPLLLSDKKLNYEQQKTPSLFYRKKSTLTNFLKRVDFIIGKKKKKCIENSIGKYDKISAS